MSSAGIARKTPCTKHTACRTQSIPPSVFVLAENSFGAFQVPQQINNPHSNAGDVGSIPGSGRSPGEGNGNLLQYSRLGNPMDRGVWWATVHGVAKSRTLLMQLSTHTCNRDYMAHGLKCLLSDHLQKKFVLL